MKNLRLNTARLQLKKGKIFNLSNEEMTKIAGGTLSEHSTLCPSAQHGVCWRSNGCYTDKKG